MNTTDLYQKAVASLTDRHAVATADLRDGSTVFCCIDKVAGEVGCEGPLSDGMAAQASRRAIQPQDQRAKAVELLAP